MRSNLAYKIRNEEDIKKRNELEKIRIREDINSDKKVYATFALYGIIILSVAYIYVNSIIKKTNSNIKLKEKTQNEKVLLNQVKELESNYNVAINLDKVEEISKKELKMKIADEIRYIKLK
ncbi:MAG: hypothetical protein ACQERZ_05015 [Fusobacteriota bacterium]